MTDKDSFGANNAFNINTPSYPPNGEQQPDIPSQNNQWPSYGQYNQNMNLPQPNMQPSQGNTNFNPHAPQSITGYTQPNFYQPPQDSFSQPSQTPNTGGQGQEQAMQAMQTLFRQIFPQMFNPPPQPGALAQEHQGGYFPPPQHQMQPQTGSQQATMPQFGNIPQQMSNLQGSQKTQDPQMGTPPLTINPKPEGTQVGSTQTQGLHLEASERNTESGTTAPQKSDTSVVELLKQIEDMRKNQEEAQARYKKVCDELRSQLQNQDSSNQAQSKEQMPENKAQIKEQVPENHTQSVARIPSAPLTQTQGNTPNLADMARIVGGGRSFPTLPPAPTPPQPSQSEIEIKPLYASKPVATSESLRKATTVSELNSEERLATIIANIPEYVLPYSHESGSDIAWQILNFYGCKYMLGQDPPEVGGLWKPTPDTIVHDESYASIGLVRRSIYPDLDVKCTKCFAKHPRETCGKFFQVASHVFNRDPIKDKDNPSRPPCGICYYERKFNATKDHLMHVHGMLTWYEHPDNPPLVEILQISNAPQQILKIVPYYKPWPSCVRRYQPLPLYCFLPREFPQPEEPCPVLTKALQGGLRAEGDSLEEAVNRQLSKEASRAQYMKYQRNQTSSKNRRLVREQEFHYALPAPGLTQDGKYVIDGAFIQILQPLFIEEHRAAVPRYIAITKHYSAYLEAAFKGSSELELELIGKNNFLWKQILIHYAKLWSPPKTKLEPVEEARLRVSWDRVSTTAARDFRSAPDIVPKDQHPQNLAELVRTLPRNPDDKVDIATRHPLIVDVSLQDPPRPAVQAPAPPQAASNPQDIAKYIKETGLDACELFWDPIKDRYDTYAPPEPTNDKEAKEQIEHFEHNYENNLPDNSIEQWEAGFENLFEPVTKYASRGSTETSDQVEHHKDQLKELAIDLLRVHLEIKGTAREYTLEAFKALRNELNDSLDAYKDKVESLRIDMVMNDGVHRIFYMKMGLPLWPLMLGKLLPAEQENCTRHLREITLPESIKATISWSSTI